MVSSSVTDFHYKEELIRTAKEITGPGKGILAADEVAGVSELGVAGASQRFYTCTYL
jgi:hypothetical protein